MDFGAVFGNEKTRERLSSAVRGGKLAHAYILKGPRGSGKHTLALSVAAALCCENTASASLPCMRCTTCKRIFAGQFTDLKVLSLQSTKASIGVDEVRVIREDMFLSAGESNYKIYLFENADKLTVQAQNALLKVLEEPIAGTLIFLLCESADKLLTTIRSRAPLISMEYLNESQIDAYLMRQSTEAERIKQSDPEGYREVLMRADGAIGRALLALKEDEIKQIRREYRDVRELLLAFSPRVPYEKMLEAISTLPSRRADFLEIMESVLLALSDLIKRKKCEDAPTRYFPNAREADDVAGEFQLGRLLYIYELILEAIEKASQNANMTALTSLLGAKLKYNS